MKNLITIAASDAEFAAIKPTMDIFVEQGVFASCTLEAGYMTIRLADLSGLKPPQEGYKAEFKRAAGERKKEWKDLDEIRREKYQRLKGELKDAGYEVERAPLKDSEIPSLGQMIIYCPSKATASAISSVQGQ